MERYVLSVGGSSSSNKVIVFFFSSENWGGEGVTKIRVREKKKVALSSALFSFAWPRNLGLEPSQS